MKDCDLLQKDLNKSGQIAGNFSLVCQSVRLSLSLTSTLQLPLLTQWIIYHFNGQLQYSIWCFISLLGQNIVKLLLQKLPNVWTIYSTPYGVPS